MKEKIKKFNKPIKFQSIDFLVFFLDAIHRDSRKNWKILSGGVHKNRQSKKARDKLRQKSQNFP
jgi:hypothetical protein